MNKTTRNALTLTALLLAPLAALQAAETKPAKPNIVVMIVDDLGCGDVSCLFRQVVKTPNIDRMAKAGVTLTQGYATAPLCAPSRAGFFSGRYQQRFGFDDNDCAIPTGVELMPAAFHKAGYATCLLGKWHSKGPNPNERGFDEFFGYYGPFLNYQQPVLFRNGKKEPHDRYSSDLFADEAVRYIDQHKNAPFFLTVAFNAPHIAKVVQGAGKIWADYNKAVAEKRIYDIPKIKTARPGEAKPLQDQFPGDTARADTVATIVALDQAVGRILDKIKRTGLDRKTIVVFFSDNGGHPENRSENLPLFEYKWSMFEGGIRVPFFVVWPGVIPSGIEYKHPVSAMDLYPTCAAAAGVTTADTQDGVNLVPFLQGEKAASPHEFLSWRLGHLSAIRQGKWKLIFGSRSPVTAGKLYDIDADFEEQYDLAAQNPEVVATLRQKWNQWNSGMEPYQPKKGLAAIESALHVAD